MFVRLFVKCTVILIACLSLNANGSMPTIFIGTYSEPNSNTLKNLVVPNAPSVYEEGNWNLTKHTEDLLKTFKGEFKSKSFSLITKKEFSENLSEIVNSSDMDKKIGFLNVDTYQNIDKNGAGEELITVTISLIYAEIGEEENRAGENNDFEVRYTNGITVTGIVEIPPNETATARDKKIHSGYKNFYTMALYDLMKLISSDAKSKKVTSFSASDDVFFSIGNMKINKKAKELAIKVYGDEEQATKQLLMMLQENLIKAIRQDKKLDDVVLLYPEKLNALIVNNWGVYLKRMNEVSGDGNKNNNSDVFVRAIKPSCQRATGSSREIPLDGYLLEVYLSELYDKVAKKGDVDSAHFVKAGLASRIIIPLKHKSKIDGMSVPSQVITKKKICIGQANDGYNLENGFSDVRKNKVAKTIRKSVEDITPKLVEMIKNIMEKRANGFEYEEFCKE